MASCGRTCLPTGEAAAKVKSILKEQNSAESAMRVLRLGSRTGSRPVRKSFGECCSAFVCAECSGTGIGCPAVNVNQSITVQRSCVSKCDLDA